MTETESNDLDEPAIGVGVGGSCPVCHAPLDLGQQFCLECGSSAAARPSTPLGRGGLGGRRPDAATAPGPAGAPAPPAPPKAFPWVPFAIVLVLLAAGIGFVVFGGSDEPRGRSSKVDAKTDTSGDLPELENTVPTDSDEAADDDDDDDASTDPAAGGAAFTNCDPSLPLDPAATPSNPVPTTMPLTTMPATPTDETPLDAIPTLGADGTVQETTRQPVESAATATLPAGAVDENGQPCSVDPAASTGAIPGSTDPGSTGATSGPISQPTGVEPFPSTTTPSAPTTTPGTTTQPSTPTSAPDDDWTDGKDGFTVIVAGFAQSENYTEQDATDRAARVRAAGLKAGVLDSSDYVSLCPGFWVVFSGEYTSEAKAEAHVSEVQAAGFDSVYVRPVRTDGAPADC